MPLLHLIDCILPDYCVKCSTELHPDNRLIPSGKRLAAICRRCHSRLFKEAGQVCTCCAEETMPDGYCASCDERRVFLDQMLVCYHSQPSGRAVTSAWKYNSRFRMFELFKPRLARLVKQVNGASLTVIPPKPGERLGRHLQQACRFIEKETGRVFTEVLQNRQKESQKSLDVHERKLLMPGSFPVKKEWRGKLSGDFAVLDDFSTTGATLNEAARVLKQNGAARVFGICFFKFKRYSRVK